MGVKEKITNKDIRAELSRRSFYFFLKEFINEIEPSAGNFVWNWHIKYLCDEFQEFVNAYVSGDPYHLNVNICPGTTKSTIFSRAAVAWAWIDNPQLTFINVTRDNDNAKGFALKCKEILESERYKEYYDLNIKQKPDSMLYFENEQGGVRYGLTTTAKGSTGKHADIQIWDDVYAYSDTESPTMVGTLEGYLDGLLSRFKNKDRGVICNVMQRLGYNDPTAYLFTGYRDKEAKLIDFKNIILPAEESELVEPKELKENYIDGLLDVKRLNRDVLSKEKRKYGFRYAAQFEQTATQSKEGLMYPQLQYYNHDIDLNNALKFSFTDPAESGADYFCTWFAALIGESIYVYDCIYTRDDSTSTIVRYQHEVEKQRTTHNIIEVNGMGGTFLSQLKLRGVRIKPYRATVRKDVRLLSYCHLVDKFYFKDNHRSEEYNKALLHLKQTPKNIPNGGKGMDIDSADAFTQMIEYFYKKYKRLFI